MQNENALLEDIKSRFESALTARSLAVRNDRALLKFLLQDSEFSDEYRARFFSEVCGSLVFLKEKFIDFLDLRLLNASFTSFGNKIGLGSIHKKYLRQSEEVVLNFPFKDGVLKGGQSKDESKSEELFFNETLARSEIDMLFKPKVLQNFELINNGGGG